MPSFFNLLTAAGNSAMPNTVNPMFMMVPVYNRNATNGPDYGIFDVMTVEPNVYMFQGDLVVNGNKRPTINLLTGSASGAPVISFLNANTANTQHGSLNKFNDSSFSNQSYINKISTFYTSFDDTTLFPDPLGTYNVSTYSFLSPESTTVNLKYRVKRDTSVYNVIDYADPSLGNLVVSVIEKLTNGVQQYARRVRVVGVSTTAYGIYPLSDGTVIFITSQGLCKLSSTGTVLWTKGNISGVSDAFEKTAGQFSPDEAYLYVMEGLLLFRINTSNGTVETTTVSFTSPVTATAGPVPGSLFTTRNLAVQSNGNIWVIATNENAISDTVACFTSAGVFVRKYSIEQGNGFRARIGCIDIDGEHLILGGYLPSSSTVVKNAVLSKLALDGSTTGSGYVGAIDFGDPVLVTISTSTSGTNFTFTTPTQTAPSFVSTAITYTIEPKLAAGKTTQTNSTRNRQTFML